MINGQASSWNDVGSRVLEGLGNCYGSYSNRKGRCGKHMLTEEFQFTIKIIKIIKE